MASVPLLVLRKNYLKFFSASSQGSSSNPPSHLLHQLQQLLLSSCTSCQHPYGVPLGLLPCAGELVWLPRQVPHTFANLGDEPVWAFGVTTPAGLEGMFEDQRAYFAGLQGAPDPDRIREIGARYGVRSLGPPISLE